MTITNLALCIPRSVRSRNERSLRDLVACLASAIVLAASIPDARADDSSYTLEVENEFASETLPSGAESDADGPLLDAERTRLSVFAPSAAAATTHFDCDTIVEQSGNDIVMIAFVHPAAPSSDFCEAVAQAYFGPLAPGQYQVTVHVIGEHGTLADLSMPIVVTPRGAKCNVNPFIYTIIANPQHKTPELFGIAFQTDPAYRSQFGDVTYVRSGSDFVLLGFPPLADPVRVLTRLRQTDEFSLLGTNGFLCFSPGPPDQIATVVEYHNTILDRYFMTSDAHEQSRLDAGISGPGWVRTGETFKVIVGPSCPQATEGGFHPVYRFAGIPHLGPDSHFFTVSQDECAVLRDKTEWHWQLEGAPFWATETSQGTCPSSTKVLYRAYNNGQGGVANHRYSTDPAIIAAMVAQGWISEGAVMCIVP